MPTPNTKPNTTKPKIPRLALVLAALAVIIGLAWGGMVLYAALNKSMANYAEEVAKPLEQALVKAGGTKKMSGGESGRSSDNTAPYYDAIYDLAIDKAAAIELIHAIAEENGYQLTHATPDNSGHLKTVAGEFLDGWYFDNTSKSSTFSDLSDGPIEVAVRLGDEDSPDQPGHTSIRISVQLPDFRR